MLQCVGNWEVSWVRFRSSNRPGGVIDEDGEPGGFTCKCCGKRFYGGHDLQV